MLRAFSELTHPTGHVSDTALSDGIPNTIKIGQSVECVVDKLYYRQPVAYADESQRFLIEQGLDLGGEFLLLHQCKSESTLAHSIANSALNRNLVAGPGRGHGEDGTTTTTSKRHFVG